MISRPRTYIGRVVVPALSILLALLVASVLIIASGLIGPEKKVDLLLPLVAYRSLLLGSFGSFKGIANMIVAATPLMLTGLAVGVGLKAGLFNIGATGQPAPDTPFLMNQTLVKTPAGWRIASILPIPVPPPAVAVAK